MRREVLEKGEQSLIEKEADKKESGQIFGEGRYNSDLKGVGGRDGMEWGGVGWGDSGQDSTMTAQAQRGNGHSVQASNGRVEATAPNDCVRVRLLLSQQILGFPPATTQGAV